MLKVLLNNRFVIFSIIITASVLIGILATFQIINYTVLLMGLIILYFLIIKKELSLIYLVLFSSILLPYINLGSFIATIRFEDLIIFLMGTKIILDSFYARKFQMSLIEVLLLLLFFILILSSSYSLFYSGSSELLIIGHLKFLIVFFLFNFVRKRIHKEEDIKKVIKAFITFSLVSLIIGILAYQRWFGVFDLVNILYPSPSGSISTLRATGTFDGNPNYFGTLLLLLFCFSFSFFINQQKRYNQIILLVIALLSLYGIFITRSRGVFLALIISFIVIALFKKKVALLVGTIFFTIVIALVNDNILSYFTSITTTSGVKMSRIGSITDRINMWEGGLKEFAERNLMGSGLSNHIVVDNYYLDILFTYGFLGLLFQLLIIISLIYYGIVVIKNSKKHFIISFSVCYVSFSIGLLVQSISASPITNERISILYWIFSAIVYTIYSNQKNSEIEGKVL
ncbi:O-antigen ligase family protein [Peribacillus frigoritolerans]|uniref:O-antigen ligase family protein n=1 Tax=Peribacillus frigoritolerans TaxID=450367 RepID=UPI00207AD550|nr:O-antigen ligase family protein [Peribacillus frigoritolerans]USK78800.1 O-antigen ligase family protein [Peribacillus frigoritolerans]